MYKTNILKLLAIRFFQSLIPAYVIERLFWEDRGMTIPMVVYAEIIFAVTVVLFEVPTGILADRWGRKKLIALSALLGCFEFLILVFAHEFWHFAAVVFLAGIATTASSGSENALLYDSLRATGEEGQFEKHLGRLGAVDFLSAMLAALSGSLLAGRFDLELNYWLSFAATLAGLVITLTLKEPERESEPDEAPKMKEYVSASLSFFRRNPDVSLVLSCGMVAGTCMGFVYEFWQLYLERIHVQVAYFGLFSSAIMLLGLPGSLLAHRLKSRWRYRAPLSFAIAVMAAGFACLAAFKGMPGLAAILAISAIAGIAEPLTAGFLHHRIGDSSMRATLDSFRSLGQNALLAACGLGFGYFSSRYDVFGGYGFLAALCAVFWLFFVAASRHMRM